MEQCLELVEIWLNEGGACYAMQIKENVRNRRRKLFEVAEYILEQAELFIDNVETANRFRKEQPAGAPN